MRTALRMYNDMERRGYNPGLGKKECVDLFEEIISFLDPDEFVRLAFIAEYEYKMQPCALTNKKIIVITKRPSLFNRKTHASFFHIEKMALVKAENVKQSTTTLRLQEKDGRAILLEIKNQFIVHLAETIVKIANGEDGKSTKSGSISIAKEIERFKKLLDNGTITQEEFEQQKQKLLDA